MCTYLTIVFGNILSIFQVCMFLGPGNETTTISTSGGQNNPPPVVKALTPGKYYVDLDWF